MAVLITGAAGSVGTMLRERLPAQGWEMRYFDRVPVPDDGTGTPSVQGDLNDAAALDAAFGDDTDAVVHLAGHPGEAPWEAIRTANIDGVHALFEAARRHGVTRVVLASSNHAVGFTPRTDDLPAGGLPDDTPPRPDTLYGVSKAFGEALGRYYVERYGFQVACLRIGSCHDDPSGRRELSTWLSPDDLAGLVDAALRSSTLTFATVWGVSANRDRWWSLDGSAALGWTPQDDAFAVRPELADEAPADTDVLVGGPYTGARFGIDEVREQARA